MKENCPSYRRHDISDTQWDKLKNYLPGTKGKPGRTAENNRNFINAVLWILRTGSPWRDLPPDFGKWNSVHRRFSSWRDKGIWETLLEKVIDYPDLEWIMIDASHVKVHPHASGAKNGNQNMSHTKGGLNSKIHLTVDAHGNPLKAIITEGTTADCTKADELIEGLSGDYLLADRGYDNDSIVNKSTELGMIPVIPPKKIEKLNEVMINTCIK